MAINVLASAYLALLSRLVQRLFMCLFVQQDMRWRHVSIWRDRQRSHVGDMLNSRTCFHVCMFRLFHPISKKLDMQTWSCIWARTGCICMVGSVAIISMLWFHFWICKVRCRITMLGRIVHLSLVCWVLRMLRSLSLIVCCFVC